MMKIFLDTAIIEDIRSRDSTGLIDGVTTNPSLIRKSGGDPVEVVRAISEEFPHFESISAEVVADTAIEMIDQKKTDKTYENSQNCSHSWRRYRCRSDARGFEGLRGCVQALWYCADLRTFRLGKLALLRAARKDAAR